jgi:hypothetical protein
MTRTACLVLAGLLAGLPLAWQSGSAAKELPAVSLENGIDIPLDEPNEVPETDGGEIGKGGGADNAAEARALAAYPKTLPACNNHEVLETIQIRFGQRETNYWDDVGFWDDLWDDADLVIERFDRVRRTADKPWGSKFIPRRFCTARATLSNGKQYQIAYSIIEDGGMIGFNYGVEWCMVGLDRQYRFAPGCRAARP